MSEVLDWDTKGTCEAEIGELKDSLSVNEKILWLQIAMEHLVFMAFGNTI